MRKGTQLEQFIEKHRTRLELSDSTQTTAGITLSLPQKIAYSPHEIATLLGVSLRTVERMLKRGEIQYKKIGRRVVIPVNAIEAWLNKKD